MTQTAPNSTDLLAAPVHGRLVLALACLSQFMVILDATIVNVALPSIRVGLGFSGGTLSWVVNAYTLTFAGLLLLVGGVIDLYGLRRVLLTGIVVFAAASLAAGQAPNAATLIVARAVQGLGAAVLSPASLAIVTTMFGGAARTRATGAWSAVAAIGGVAGNLLGGVLTGLLSWRWIFYINVPVAVVLVGAALVGIPAVRAAGERRRLDIAGAASATAGLTLLAYGIVEIPQRGAAADVIGSIAGGLILLAGFVAIETRWTTNPLVPPRLLAIRPVRGGVIVMIMFGATSLPMWYFISLSLQNVLRMSALASGLAMVPFAAALAVCARLAPRLTARFGDRTLIVAGSVLSAAGFAVQSRFGGYGHYLTTMLGPGLLMSAGAGLVIAPLVNAATTAGRQDAGVVAGIVNAARQIGGSLGLSLLVCLAAAGVVASPAASYGRVFTAEAVISALTAVAALTFLPRNTSQNGA